MNKNNKNTDLGVLKTTCQSALVNLTHAIRMNQQFPKNVFLAMWSDFYFFDSDFIFQPQFVEKVKSLLEIEGGECVCMSNLIEVEKGRAWEQCSLFIDKEMTSETYNTFLCGSGPAEGWLYKMDSFGCTSNISQWCIYCEKNNEIGVIAIREYGSQEKFQPVIRQLGALPIKLAIEKPLSYGFSQRALSVEWREELLKQYAK